MQGMLKSQPDECSSRGRRTQQHAHGDISPSPAGDGVSDTPSPPMTSTIDGHSSQEVGKAPYSRAQHTPTRDEARAQCLLLGTHWPRSHEPSGTGCHTTIDFPIPEGNLNQHLGRWRKVTLSNDFSYFRVKPILEDCCLSVCCQQLLHDCSVLVKRIGK